MTKMTIKQVKGEGSKLVPAKRTTKKLDPKTPAGKKAVAAKMTKLAEDYEAANPGATAKGRSKFTGDRRKLVSGSASPQPDAPRPARLARGLDSRNAPQSAKAAADSQRAEPKAAKATKRAEPKAAKNKQPSKGADYAYTVGTKFDRKPDTWTAYMVTLTQKHGDTAKAKAAHAKSGQYSNKKLDFNWMLAKGFIKRAK